MTSLHWLKYSLLASTAAIPVALAPHASAQGLPQSQATGVQEVVVTASRREEAVSKVPISVAAYSKQRLDQQGVRSIDDISRLTPGVTFSRGDTRNAGSSNIAIRGIVSSVASSTTGIYIDDTPIQTRIIGAGASNFNTFPAIFDLDRVEVLRGPQGTLFGAGSEGGTVRFITPKPSLTGYSAYARGEVGYTEGGAPSYEAGVAVGGPIVENKLAFRISGWTRRDGGYIDRVNTDPLPGDAPLAVFNKDPSTPPTVLPTRTRVNSIAEKNANYQDSNVGRAALTWAPIAGLQVTGSVYYQKTKYNDSNVYWESLSNPGESQYAKGTALGQPSVDRFTLPAVAINWDVGPVRLVSNTSYLDRHQTALNDYTEFESALWAHFWEYPVGMSAPTNQINDQTGFNQEFRIESADPQARLKWVAGLFFQKNHQVSRQFVQDTFLPSLFQDVNGAPFAAVFGQGLANGLYTFVQNPVNAHDRQLALFGQADFNLTEKLRLTAGLRWSDTKFDATADYYGPVVGPPVHDGGQKTEKPLTPKFGISYQATPDNLFYASASKGFRIGGYNPQVGLPCSATLAAYGYSPSAGNATGRPPTFDSDSLWSYEIGAKNNLFGGRAQINASAYYIDWNNIQQGIALNACGFQFTANLGKAVSEGAELETAFRLTDHLTFGAAVGYDNAKFKKTVNLNNAPFNLVTAGDRLPGSPWTVTLNGQYDFDLLSHGAFIRFDYEYHSRGPDNTTALDPRDRPPLPPADPAILIPTPATNLLSLRAGVQVGGSNISVFVKNLLNEHPNLARGDLAFSPTATGGADAPNYTGITLRPRTVGVTLTARY